MHYTLETLKTILLANYYSKKISILVFLTYSGHSLFAENGVIVRYLNYRPWQWVYSISGYKSFPGGF